MRLSNRNQDETVIHPGELIKINKNTWTLPRKLYVGTNALLNSNIGRNFELPNTYIELGMSSFADNSHLVNWKAEQGSKLKVIGSSAFSRCDMLCEVEIPETVEKIGSYAFKNCENLEKLTLPEGLKELGEGFAEGCYRLKELTCGIDLLPIIRKQRSQLASLKHIVFLKDGQVVRRDEYSLRNTKAINYVRRETLDNYLHDYDEGYNREEAEKNDDFVK